MKIYSLYLTYRNMRRLSEIVSVLFRYGFSHVVENTDLKRFIPFYSRLLGKRISRHALGGVEVRLRLAFEELGPTFVKFGQMLSRRTDLLPENYIREFSKLEDRVTPVAFSEIRRTLDSIYGARYYEIFSAVEEEPVASASIAQVHRGVLKNGSVVVLKIKRPGIDEVVSNDFIVLGVLVEFIHRHFPELRNFNLSEVVSEFGRMIRKELDFGRELTNMERMRSVFGERPGILIPKTYSHLSGRDILVMEMIESSKVTEAHTASETAVAAYLQGLDSLTRAVFETGFFHADLHPGNIGITPSKGVVLYDFGNVGFLSRKVRTMSRKLLFSLLRKDYEYFSEVLYDYGVIEDQSSVFSVERELMEAIEWRTNLSVKEFDMAGLLMDIMTIVRKYHLNVPVEALGFFRTTLLLDAAGKALIPGFSINVLLSGVFADELKSGFKSGDKVGELFEGVNDMKKTLFKVPRQIERIMNKMINDKFTVDFVHVNLEPFIDEIKKSTNRLSLSLIVSALIIGSALVFFSDRGIQVFGYPVLGIIGFGVSMVLGFYLLFSIIMSRRL